MVRPDPRPTRRTPLTAVRVLVDAALILVVGLGLSGVVLGRLVPALGHPVYVVAGPSMEPTIHLGSAVVLTPVAPGSLAVDDIVSLRSGPSRAVFTHRIIRIAEREGQVWIRTKGDANDAPDPAISPSGDVIGRVTTVIPYAGYALTLLSAPAGVALVLSLGATLMVLGWYLDGVVVDRRDRRRAPAPFPPARTGAPSRPRRLNLPYAWPQLPAFAAAGELGLAVVGPSPGAASRAAVHLAALPGVAVRLGVLGPLANPSAPPTTATTTGVVAPRPEPIASPAGASAAPRPTRTGRTKAASKGATKVAPKAAASTSAPKRTRTRAARAAS